jgi:hypothetical protein
MKLPNELQLFTADVIDEDTGVQEFWNIVGETYESALQMFVEWANEYWCEYTYYFYVADDDAVEDFMEWHDGEDIAIGMYDR